MTITHPSVTTSPNVLIDQHGVIMEASAAFCKLVGLHRAEGRRYRDLLGDDMRRRWPLLRQDIFAGREQTEEHFFFNGSTAMIRFKQVDRLGKGPMISGVVLGFAQSAHTGRSRVRSPGSREYEVPPRGSVATFEHLTTRIDQLERQLDAAQNASFTDPLTGLLNQAGLYHQMHGEILKLGTEGARLHLVVVDIDDFKRVNDFHGQPAGDKLLRMLARRLKKPSQVICAARIGGDRFALLIRSSPGGGDDLISGLNLLLVRMFKPALVDGVRLRLSGSAGVSAFGVDAYDIDDLFRNADAALLEAKRQGKDRVQLFDTELAAQTRRRKVLFKDLKLAISEGLLHPVYQPIVSTQEQNFVGVEVLCRWVHHEFGNIPPDEFIAIAAECGLMPALDLGMAATACAELHSLIATKALKFVSFNLSPLELSHQGYVETFLAILQAADIPPGRVFVEVTENEMIRNFQEAEIAIKTLKAAGVHIVLDDYGTGYSNLRALLDLPIDVIKIDKSLIAGVAQEERTMQVVLSVVHLARVLGAQLVAEGIETAAQAAVTKALGCQYVQGFLFSKPMRLSGLGEWLRQNAKGGHDAPRTPNSERNGQFKLVS